MTNPIELQDATQEAPIVISDDECLSPYVSHPPASPRTPSYETYSPRTPEYDPVFEETQTSLKRKWDTDEDEGYDIVDFNLEEEDVACSTLGHKFTLPKKVLSETLFRDCESCEISFPAGDIFKCLVCTTEKCCNCFGSTCFQSYHRYEVFYCEQVCKKQKK